MRYTLTIRGSQREQLEHILLRDDGREGAAYLLCGRADIVADPWTGSGARRFFVREVLPVAEVVSSSATDVTWRTADYVRLTARCEQEGLAIFIAHSHPKGSDQFSEVDDANEARLFPYALDKLGDVAIVGSILMRYDKSLIGRVWLGEPIRNAKLDSIFTIGGRWILEGQQTSTLRATLDRQARALGSRFNDSVNRLRIGVIGCGATGSAAAVLLARLGVGKLVLFDADHVDVTNLHRLHGAGQSDADAGRNKADVLCDTIAALGLGCNVRSLQSFVEQDETRDAIRSCDVILSCTDDHFGRAVLSRVAYFYLIPVIDVGVILHLRKDQTGLSHVEGRATVMQPGTPCLFCREVITPEGVRADQTRRRDPEQYERLKAEGYIVGGGDPSPAVITFTTETASIGVTELIQRLTHFRGADGNADQRFRHFLDGEDSKAGRPSLPTCRVCGSDRYWAMGDLDPFLDMSL